MDRGELNKSTSAWFELLDSLQLGKLNAFGGTDAGSEEQCPLLTDQDFSSEVGASFHVRFGVGVQESREGSFWVLR